MPGTTEKQQKNQQRGARTSLRRDLCRKWGLTPRDRSIRAFFARQILQPFFFHRFWPARRGPEKPEKRPENSDDEARTLQKCTSLCEFLIKRNESAILPSRHSPSRRFENSRGVVQKAHQSEGGLAGVALNPNFFLWVAWGGNSSRRGRPGEATSHIWMIEVGGSIPSPSILR